MAKKKKNFENVVDTSFEEGYASDPEVIQDTPKPEPTRKTFGDAHVETLSHETKNTFFDMLDKKGFDEAIKVLTSGEQEAMRQSIAADDCEILSRIFGRKDRSTYYLTDLHRACIEEAAREEDVKKNDIVVAALESYFSEEIVAAGRARIISMSDKKLKREIRKA